MTIASSVCAALAAGVCCVACSQSLTVGPPTSGEPTAVRILLLGDVMLGRSVGDVVLSAPDTVFDRLRPIVAAADLTLANLESPLTVRRHLLGPHPLEADPARAAPLLAAAGFDVMGVANNHAGDAGPSTVVDTMQALSAVGIATIGGGVDVNAAEAPLVLRVNGVRIAVLAIDLTLGGPPAGAGPGVAAWDQMRVERSVRSARTEADVVIVGLHGGVEYLPRPDPVLRDVVDMLSTWGADVVWGHGAHVPYPVAVVDGADARVSLQAPGLGNALFDQGDAGADQGMALEVLVDPDGVIAHRTGVVDSYLRSGLAAWDEPVGDVGLIGGEWWMLDRDVRPADVGAVPALVPAHVPALAEGGVLVHAVLADMTGDGIDEVVASYRTPFHQKVLHTAFPGVDFRDASGRAAHLGVFDATDDRLLWGAGTMVRPIGHLDGCDGAIAVVFTGLDDDTVIGAGAWTWRGFGFSTAVELDGESIPACADIDRDGSTEPVLLRHVAAEG